MSCLWFSKQFKQLCDDFIVISEKNMDNLKSMGIKSPHYHDQEFFFYNIFRTPANEGYDIFKDGYTESRTRPLIAELRYST